MPCFEKNKIYFVKSLEKRNLEGKWYWQELRREEFDIESLYEESFPFEEKSL